MTKRRITVLLAGALFATASGIAGAHGNAVSYSDQSGAAPGYQDDNPGTTAIPPSSDLRGQAPLPSQQRYFSEQEQRLQSGALQVPEQTITVASAADSITVDQPSVVEFVDPAGHSFVWNTSSVSEGAIPLRSIAPPGFIAGDTMVYVRNPEANMMS